MKKYRVTALPRMQEGGSKPKKKKSKYDIESTGHMYSPGQEDGIYEYYYGLYSDTTDKPTEEGFIDHMQNLGKENGVYLAPRKTKVWDPLTMKYTESTEFEEYDYSTILKKIYYEGVRPKQMAEKMNLGDRDNLETFFGDFINDTTEDYKAGNKAELERLVYQGKTPQEAIDELYKKGMGTKEGLKNLFYDDTVKMETDLLERYQKYLTKNVDEEGEVIGSKKDDIEKYEGLIDPGKVGKKIMQFDKEGNQINTPEFLRKQRLENSDEYNQQVSARKKQDEDFRRSTAVASTLSRENAPGVDALKRNQYETLSNFYNTDPTNLNNNAITYEDWLSGVNVGTQKYSQKSLDALQEDMAPREEFKPNLADYVGEDNVNVFGGVGGLGTGDVFGLTESQKDNYKAYQEDLKNWKDTPGFVYKYYQALNNDMLADKLGLDDIKNMSQEEKSKVLKMFSEELNSSTGVLKNVYDKDTKTWGPDSRGIGLTDIGNEVADNLERKLDPTNYFEESQNEEDQPSIWGQLFNLATDTKTFSDRTPIISKIKNFDPDTGELLPDNQVLNAKDFPPLYKGTGVFQDFNLPTKDLIGFDLNLAPTGIGSVALQGANALVKAGQAGAKFRGIPGFKGIGGLGLRKAFRQPMTKTLGLDALGKATGISSKMPGWLKGINKFATPSNVLGAHYTLNSPEYIENAIQKELPSAYKNLMAGKYKEAAGDAALGAWDLAAITPLLRGSRALKNFRGSKNTINTPFLKDYTVGVRGKNTGVQFNSQKNKDIKSLFSVGDPTGRFRFELGKYRPKMGEGYNPGQLQLQKEGGITKGKSKIKGAGDGMFTTTGFKKGDVIGLAHRDDQPASKLGRMHNHNEEAPTMYSKKIGNERYVFANRDLEPGEELTTNYRLQPELEQPEDFQEGGSNTIREIPKAQGGGRIVKTLKEIKNELPQVFRSQHQVAKMNPRDYSKFKDLTNLISTYAYSGIPSSKEIFSQQQLDTFKTIQRDRARKALSKALNNDAVTKEDLVSILTQSEDGSALARAMGTGTMANKTFFKATPLPEQEIGRYTRRKFSEEEDNSYLRKISESLMNKSKDELKQAVLNTESNLSAYRQQISNLVQSGMSPEEAIQHIFANKSPEVAAMLRNNPNYGISSLLEKPSFTSTEKSIEEIMQGLKEKNLFESSWREPYHEGFDASLLQPGEQIVGNFDDISEMMRSVKVKEGLGLLTQQGMPEETLNLYATRLNDAFHREKPNSIITGSLDTSADSYPMQTKRVLRASSLRRAPKLGVSETPQFLGYHSMNNMGFLNKFLTQPGLGISREEQKRIQAEFLQTQLSEIYDQAKIPVEQRLPIMQVPLGAGNTMDYRGREFYSGDILLPQFGVLKKDVQWPEDHKRMLLQDGGSPGVSPPSDLPEGFSSDPRAFRGQVPRKMIRQQRKSNKELMEKGMGVYGVDLEREKGVPPYNFDKQPREQRRLDRQEERQARRDARPPRRGTSHPIDTSNKWTWWSHHTSGDNRAGKKRYGPKLFQSRKIKMQEGGFIESELNQKEIDSLVKQGYIIEDM